MQSIMSNPADDDIWAGVRQDTAENASKMMAATNSLAQRLESGLGLTPSSHSLGALEKRETATDAFVPEVNATRLDWDKTGEETDGPILGRGRRRAKSKPAPT
ncbi:MAG: hypothetical protein RLZZ157_1324, partial [Pseudomonadota bacterium]